MSKDSEKLATLEAKVDSALQAKDEAFERADKTHETIMQQLKEFGDKLEEVKISIATLPKQLTDEFDKRYASKDTEKALKKINWLVISSVIVALLSLIFIEYK